MTASSRGISPRPKQTNKQTKKETIPFNFKVGIMLRHHERSQTTSPDYRCCPMTFNIFEDPVTICCIFLADCAHMFTSSNSYAPAFNVPSFTKDSKKFNHGSDPARKKEPLPPIL